MAKHFCFHSNFNYSIMASRSLVLRDSMTRQTQPGRDMTWIHSVSQEQGPSSRGMCGECILWPIRALPNLMSDDHLQIEKSGSRIKKEWKFTNRTFFLHINLLSTTPRASSRGFLYHNNIFKYLYFTFLEYPLSEKLKVIYFTYTFVYFPIASCKNVIFILKL